MRHRHLCLLVLLVAVAVAGFGSNGETINIGGVVPLNLQLAVTPHVLADNLTLVGTNDPHTQEISGIVIATNNSAGWELWVFSANAAGANTSLINSDADEIAYTITYSGAGGVATTDIPAIGLKIGEEGDATGDTGAISITYAQTESYPAGYYSDQLAIVLRAK